jgi:hypothetical protein
MVASTADQMAEMWAIPLVVKMVALTADWRVAQSAPLMAGLLVEWMVVSLVEKMVASLVETMVVSLVEKTAAKTVGL